MAREEDEDLYDEEFDFVDDDDASALDDDSPLADEAKAADGEVDERDRGERGRDDHEQDGRERDGRDRDPRERDETVEDDVVDDEPVDEYGRPEPAANYVVHVYEHQKFKRTIDRPFTPEDAEAFATEFNRTGKSYGRVAVSGKNDAKPKKALD